MTDCRDALFIRSDDPYALGEGKKKDFLFKNMDF